MPNTVPVTLELDAETATALRNPATLARAELLIRRLTATNGLERPVATMDTIVAAAERGELSDKIPHLYLITSDAETIDRDAPDRVAGAASGNVVSRFPSLTARQTLGTYES